MRGWSVLGNVPLTGSGVFSWSLLMARWIDSKARLVTRERNSPQTAETLCPQESVSDANFYHKQVLKTENGGCSTFAGVLTRGTGRLGPLFSSPTSLI